MFFINVNRQERAVDMPSDTPLLWALRDYLGLTGTKFGCGVAQCGACTVHVNGNPTYSCITSISAVVGKNVTTIEGLSARGDHPIQKAFLDHNAFQCGYCTSGQIMEAAALLRKNKNPTREQILASMSGHLCRCGCYNQIVAAVQQAAREV
jgi:aerobic-type carbon monoxide dehydrogenase small subunit (CoxS/CutS family)